MSESQQKTDDGREGQDTGGATADTVSDPARSDEPGQDWSTEGGATPAGPATDVDPDQVADDT
ncbi:hypothetical protein [Marmoricola sp. RAF53]|uniref:hypothetical protein n=1 Tax=Marmoricola sp. RAF53 TaxID=3233059 RepID=UPI003F958C66